MDRAIDNLIWDTFGAVELWNGCLFKGKYILPHCLNQFYTQKETDGNVTYYKDTVLKIKTISMITGGEAPKNHTCSCSIYIPILRQHALDISSLSLQSQSFHSPPTSVPNHSSSQTEIIEVHWGTISNIQRLILSVYTHQKQIQS